MIHEMKTAVVEGVQIYLPKAMSSLILISTAWMETVDWTIRVAALLLGLVVSIYTVRRISIDIEMRKEEIREKKLMNKKLEEQIRKDYERKK